MNDPTDRGARFFGDVMGREQEADLRREIAGQHEFGGETAKFSADFAFGTIWTRGGLERKCRSLVVLGILIAQRQTVELKYHVKVAIANGLTVKELEEVLYQALPYAGFPAVNSAKSAMIEALAALEQGKEVAAS